MVECWKVRYPDRIAALLAMAKIRRQGNREREVRHAYRCPACKGWHLTSGGRRQG